MILANIFQGKSSFLDIMSSVPGVEVYHEPVDTWRDVGGENMISDWSIYYQYSLLIGQERTSSKR